MIIKYSYERRNYHSSPLQKAARNNSLGRGKPEPPLTARYLRQLPVSSSEASQAFLEEGVDLRLLYGGGQVHGVQRAGVLVTTRSREGERDHRGLLPLGQEMQEGEPHGSVLGWRGGRGWWMRTGNRRMV